MRSNARMMHQEKVALRRSVRSQRDAVPAEARARWSAQICAAAIAHPAYVRSHTVHVFLSFQSEIDTSAIIAHALASDRRVVVPVFPPGSSETPAVEITTLDDAAFEFGRWGMRTPKVLREVALDAIDLVFAPLVCFAAIDGGRFARIGYGAGYYDRLLTRLSPGTPCIGLAFAMQRVGIVPIEEHDRMLDEVLTDCY
jgi:5-formyltetrahydrofolate cyclo-ligase